MLQTYPYNRIRGGKIIPYNKEDGHRIKDKGVNWVHSLLKKQGVFNQDWTLTQCLFGEHLLSLSANRDKVVAVVESEKTAIICSVQYPDCIWLATGGKSQLSIDKMRVLANRGIIFPPRMRLSLSICQKMLSPFRVAPIR